MFLQVYERHTPGDPSQICEHGWGNAPGISQPSQPVPLSWDSILALGTYNQFIDTKVMDWILCMSPEVVGHTSYAENYRGFVGLATSQRTD